MIERNGKQLLSLINDVLDIARIESGNEEFEISAFNAKNLIAEIVEMIHPQAKQKKIDLRQTTTDSDIEIRTDANKLRHILQNIIGNAVKFTEKGKVEVKAELTVKNIIITVTDTGIGISEESQLHIFDEFRQADGSTSRKYGGTGLGLAIAKKYANLLGGTIAVKSESGKGAAFTIILPVAYALENKITAVETNYGFNFPLKAATLNSTNNPASKTILIVEDSEPAIIQLKDILAETGYLTLEARNGEEAAQIVLKTIPDAIILDLMMPGIDGFEVLKSLRENDRTALIPVLILTAKHITKEELKFLKRNNVHQLIQKGDVNRDDLLNSVAGMVFPEVKSAKAVQKISGKPLVLVIEDNADNRITVKALLGDHYEMIEAINGTQGIELAQKNIPNLILMDIALPGIDGIEAFKIIRNLPKLNHIPVIALTASAMMHDRETILAHGFDAYIAKPIDEKIFFKTINKILYGK